MIFLPNKKDFKREYNRPLAKGYKKIVVDEAVTFGSPVTIKADDEAKTLRIMPDAMNTEPDCLLLLTNEFGLFNGKYKTPKKKSTKTEDKAKSENSASKVEIENKISMIPIDNEYFIIKLFSGAVAYSIDGEIIVPNINLDNTNLNCRTDKIYWMSPLWFYSMSKYFEYPSFYYDFEHFYEISGGRASDGTYSHSRPIKEEHIDMSMGMLAMYLKEKEIKEAQREMKKFEEDIQKMASGEYQAVDTEDDYEEEVEDDENSLPDDYDDEVVFEDESEEELYDDEEEVICEEDE